MLYLILSWVYPPVSFYKRVTIPMLLREGLRCKVTVVPRKYLVTMRSSEGRDQQRRHIFFH
jgi:hypothetical protein